MKNVTATLTILVLATFLAATAHAQWGSNIRNAWDKTSEAVSETAKDVGEKGAEMMEGPPPEEERAELQEARANAMTRLSEQEPSAEQMLQDAKGYAVFSNFGMNLGFISTQRGGGILTDNRSGEEIYMKMFSAGGGIGLGIKEFAAIFVFHTDAAIDQFVTEGWDFSGQADARAKYDEEGEGADTAMTAMPGTSLYQLTESGLAAQVTLQGTKFWKDEDLN